LKRGDGGKRGQLVRLGIEEEEHWPGRQASPTGAKSEERLNTDFRLKGDQQCRSGGTTKRREKRSKRGGEGGGARGWEWNATRLCRYLRVRTRREKGEGGRKKYGIAARNLRVDVDWGGREGRKNALETEKSGGNMGKAHKMARVLTEVC